MKDLAELVTGFVVLLAAFTAIGFFMVTLTTVLCSYGNWLMGVL